MNYIIYPLNTGYVANSPKQYHYHPSTHKFHPERVDGAEDYPVFAFLIQGNGRNILVDTGMCETERAGKYHHPGSHQGKGGSIVDKIQSIGVSCEDIDTVILTHLHWDHCYHLDQFPNAVFYAHEKEIAFALDPIPLYYKSYEAPQMGIVRPFEHITFRACKGDMEILDGIRVFETPGHSPGHMAVEVDTSDGCYIIGGDCAFRLDNFSPIPEIQYDVTPPGRYYNIIESWRSLEKIKSRAVDLDHVLLTHELTLLNRIKDCPAIGR